MKIRTAVGSAALALAIAVGGAGMGATNAEAAKTPKSVVTNKEYKKIKKGQSMAKVRKITGGKGARSEMASDANEPYLWRGTKDRDVYVVFYKGKAVRKYRIVDRTVSKAEYRKIKKGMTYGQVKKIVREKGLSNWKFDNEVGYVWSTEGCDRLMQVIFVDGKLSTKDYEEYPGYGPMPCTLKLGN